jgi:hypothetical protein
MQAGDSFPVIDANAAQHVRQMSAVEGFCYVVIHACQYESLPISTHCIFRHGDNGDFEINYLKYSPSLNKIHKDYNYSNDKKNMYE